MADKGNFKGLRTIIYHVPDMDEAKAWYSLVLDKQPYYNEPYYVGFDVGGYELGLLPRGTGESPGKQTTTTYWGVDDIEQTFNRLLELGAEAREEPENVGGEIMTATVTDPWGNVVGIIYNPGFKASEK